MPRILLVEDNEMNRDMLSRRLERRGHEVLVAVDGGQGIELAYKVAAEGLDVPFDEVLREYLGSATGRFAQWVAERDRRLKP